MYEHLLTEIGLTENESKLYLSLLKEGTSSASQISKVTNVNRTTSYLELDKLIEKGLVSYTIKDSKKYFTAANPKKLLNILDLKRKKVQSIIPNLESFPQKQNKFLSDVYEGKEGLKTFYQDILNTSPKEVLAFGITGLAFDVLEFEFPHFVKECKKRKITAKYIANKDSKINLEKLPNNFVKIKYLDKQYDSKVTTIIYSGKVAIQSLIGKSIYIVVIKDEFLYESYKNTFNFMWDSAN